ncbi:MAG: hypothetical protein GY953_07345, partial [bacterium]|nr:hypothetical protein [bacterium]
MSDNNPRVLRFGIFEVDLRTRALRRNGLKVRLQDQPYRLLTLLLERSGEIVTREELREELWPNDEFGDFDLGLNTAVKKLRQALDDSAASPRWIETVPKIGYRFLAPVEGGSATAPETAPPAEIRAWLLWALE